MNALLASSQVEHILEASQDQEIKQNLIDATKRVSESGGFGAPTLIVTNEFGKKELFFGADRTFRY